MADPLRHRQTKGAATDMVDLTPPRHLPTLPIAAVRRSCRGSSLAPRAADTQPERASLEDSHYLRDGYTCFHWFAARARCRIAPTVFLLSPTWRPINRGLKSEYIPDPNAEVGHCVHRIAMHRSRPGVLFMQKHWDVMRSDDAGDSWREVSGNLPSDFGFPIAVHWHEPETIYVVPIKSDSEHFPPDGKLRVYRSRTGGNEWEALTKGLPQSDCYVNVLRDAMAVDSLDKCGVYFGTTGGQVYGSSDAGDTWNAIVRDLPAVLSVEVQTLP